MGQPHAADPNQYRHHQDKGQNQPQTGYSEGSHAFSMPAAGFGAAELSVGPYIIEHMFEAMRAADRVGAGDRRLAAAGVDAGGAAVGGCRRVVGAADREVEAEDPDPGFMMVTGFQRTTAEVAAACNLSPAAASVMVSHADALAKRLPRWRRYSPRVIPIGARCR